MRSTSPVGRRRTPAIAPEFQTSLYVYILVVLYSALIALIVTIRWGGYRRRGYRLQAATAD